MKFNLVSESWKVLDLYLDNETYMLRYFKKLSEPGKSFKADTTQSYQFLMFKNVNLVSKSILLRYC